ncbi:hypothetical protein C8J57DRAFT_1476369 [Mycena rebaudengoi]|nr:hypothetical protein C8J57DRAFT_1476369 [Mycena rebaudengoi]
MRSLSEMSHSVLLRVVPWDPSPPPNPHTTSRPPIRHSVPAYARSVVSGSGTVPCVRLAKAQQRGGRVRLTTPSSISTGISTGTTAISTRTGRGRAVRGGGDAGEAVYVRNACSAVRRDSDAVGCDSDTAAGCDSYTAAAARATRTVLRGARCTPPPRCRTQTRDTRGVFPSRRRLMRATRPRLRGASWCYFGSGETTITQRALRRVPIRIRERLAVVRREEHHHLLLRGHEPRDARAITPGNWAKSSPPSRRRARFATSLRCFTKPRPPVKPHHPQRPLHPATAPSSSPLSWSRTPAAALGNPPRRIQPSPCWRWCCRCYLGVVKPTLSRIRENTQLVGSGHSHPRTTRVRLVAVRRLLLVLDGGSVGSVCMEKALSWDGNERGGRERNQACRIQEGQDTRDRKPIALAGNRYRHRMLREDLEEDADTASRGTTCTPQRGGTPGTTDRRRACASPCAGSRERRRDDADSEHVTRCRRTATRLRQRTVVTPRPPDKTDGHAKSASTSIESDTPHRVNLTPNPPAARPHHTPKLPARQAEEDASSLVPTRDVEVKRDDGADTTTHRRGARLSRTARSMRVPRAPFPHAPYPPARQTPAKSKGREKEKLAILTLNLPAAQPDPLPRTANPSFARSALGMVCLTKRQCVPARTLTWGWGLVRVVGGEGSNEESWGRMGRGRKGKEGKRKNEGGTGWRGEKNTACVVTGKGGRGRGGGGERTKRESLRRHDEGGEERRGVVEDIIENSQWIAPARSWRTMSRGCGRVSTGY